MRTGEQWIRTPEGMSDSERKGTYKLTTQILRQIFKFYIFNVSPAIRLRHCTNTFINYFETIKIGHYFKNSVKYLQK